MKVKVVLYAKTNVWGSTGLYAMRHGTHYTHYLYLNGNHHLRLEYDKNLRWCGYNELLFQKMHGTVTSSTNRGHSPEKTYFWRFGKVAMKLENSLLVYDEFPSYVKASTGISLAALESKLHPARLRTLFNVTLLGDFQP